MSSLVRLDHRRSYAPRHMGKTFSQESGQVYVETHQRGGPMTSEWVWKTLGSSQESGRFRSLGPGCASLSNMAIRSVMVNMMSVTVENLQGVPWQVGKKLWDRIRKWYVSIHDYSFRHYLPNTYITILLHTTIRIRFPGVVFFLFCLKKKSCF